ncbi:cobalamin-independent methionine synthase II family protein [Rhodobacteraceae bacterium R_SAG10]|jgi:5-methyltetrahydropteroyltriglutamate--homocysteine methyltransferase|nr:cobalamin-independent methionine synthase II family protein [Rhodobacteraceae bacterium R_SAG10]
MQTNQEPLETTTLGSFPKPAYVPVRDWFDIARETGGMNTSQTTRDHTADLQKTDASHEALFIRAAKEVIGVQLRAGITIPTDGEVRRENYIHYHCRHLDGFDFTNLEHRVLRDGAYETDLPAIRKPIRHIGKFYGAHDYLASQSVSARPVKFTLPGPLTIMDTTADCFYDDRPKLNAALAETVNKEALALVDAGCQYIQVDEPLFARAVDDALSFGMDGLERCFHGVPATVTRVVHMCCGYPNHLDDADYKKANPNSYNRLASAIDAADFDQISIEDAHCGNDLGLLEMFQSKTVVFGTIAIASSRLEAVDEVVQRLASVLEHIDRDRLVVAPDCGLGLLPADLAEAKLRVMCDAAAQV